MMSYLLKVIICAAFFLAIYYVMLEKIKITRFNRFYLLMTLIASFIIPAITFTSEVTVFPVFSEPQDISFQPSATILIASDDIRSEQFNISSVLRGVYIIVAGVLLLRFVVNLYRLLSLAKKSKRFFFSGHTIVLLKKPTIPFSFFRFIFIYEKDYLDNNTEPEVIHHELAHVRQYHSVDILFVELLSVLAWFNPALFLYRRAIQLNHEFLADEAVVSQFKDPVAYQLLLLEKISQRSSDFSVTSSFNYKITQKRLAMISNYSSKRHKVFRFLAVVPITAAAVLLFSERSIAQIPAAPVEEMEVNGETVTIDTIPQKKQDGAVKTWVKFPERGFVGGTEAGISQAEMNEYKELIEKSGWTDKKANEWTSTPSAKMRPRMLELFSKMSRSQQMDQEVIFMNPPRPMAKNVPTAAQLENFKNASKYGVWIDLKRIDNATLSDYKPADFSQFTITKLYGKAKEGRSYTHQLNLSSNAFFEKENERRRNSKDPIAVHSVRREVIK